YWSDGAQLPPQHAAAIAAQMEALDVFDDVRTMDYEQARAQGLITLLGRETDDKFLSHVLDQINDRQAVAQVTDAFRMVYTPFHGTGYQQIPYVLEQLGIRYLHCVPEQMVIDGTFPTVKSPNPETPESFALAQKLAKEVDAQLILGSDPDADRVAIQVKDRKGDYVQISGNQTGVLLLDYLIGAKRRAGTLPENPVALKSLVTTQLAQVVAEANGVRCYNTFTGFKFMAEKKNQLEAAGQGHVIFSYEESIGYMIGDYVRDKDAVTAALLLTEMTAWYAARGMTLLDALQAIYETYGYYGENTLNLVMPGLEGMGKMQAIMAALRQTPPDQIAGTTVCLQRDYQTGTERDTATGETTAMELAGSNVLGYQLADGTTLVVRPSGTEPKIKVMFWPPAPTALTAKEKWSNTPPGPRPCGIGPIDLLSLAPPGKPAGFLFFQ
ncbi:MAG: phospho-sugar mutase, partial [Evtepia gabavorous]